MKKMTLLASLLLLLNGYLSAQSTRLITNIPADLNENSGMWIDNNQQIWLHNDGGDSAKLYALDTFGTIQKTVIVTNAANFDWEDITHDAQGNLYIGDFGNNNNNRQNLRIYKIPNPNTIVGRTTTATEIKFFYPEQTAFPAPDTDKNYDAESLIYHNDSLYIFTKDRTSPHQGYTRLYQLPTDTGTHAAILLDSFLTGQSNFVFEITGAASSPNGQQIALINANTIWVFSDFVGSDFFGGTAQTYPLGSTTQKEALDFLDDSTIYFSNENSFLGTPKLFELKLPNPTITNLVETKSVVQKMQVFPNPAKAKINLQLTVSQAQKLKINLVDATGKKIQTFIKECFTAGEHQMELDLKSIPTGAYYLQVVTGRYKTVQRVVIVE